MQSCLDRYLMTIVIIFVLEIFIIIFWIFRNSVEVIQGEFMGSSFFRNSIWSMKLLIKVLLSLIDEICFYSEIISACKLSVPACVKLLEFCDDQVTDLLIFS